MMNKKSLSDLVGETIEPAGYVKHKNCWHMNLATHVVSLFLDKSPYGGQFYIDLNLYVKNLPFSSQAISVPDPNLPAGHHRHLGHRLDRLMPDRAVLLSALNLESPMLLEERQRIIGDALKNYAVPHLKMLQSLDEVRGGIDSGQLWGFCTLTLKRHLGLPTD